MSDPRIPSIAKEFKKAKVIECDQIMIQRYEEKLAVAWLENGKTKAVILKEKGMEL